MLLSFTLTMSVCLLVFLAAALSFTVAFGERPRVEIQREEPLEEPTVLSESRLVFIRTQAEAARLAG